MALAYQSSKLQSIGQLICVFLLFLFVLFLAYMAARVTGSLQAGALNKYSNIKVIEIYRLSNTKLIEIVQIGAKYYALAVGKDDIQVICQLDPDEIKRQETTIEPINFKNILEKMKNDKQRESKEDKTEDNQ